MMVLRSNQVWSQILPYLGPYLRGTSKILVDYQHFIEKVQYAYFNVWPQILPSGVGQPPTKCSGRNETYHKQANTAYGAIWSKKMVNTAYDQKKGRYG